MERSMRVFSALLVLSLLFMATEMGPKVAEARLCESQSHHYKGPCGHEKNCAHVCKTEGFHGGKCKGFVRKCYCTKTCNP
ncbi:defensin Ec-AMP-D1-like [Telopea speciosissima]|uniref:defensin Ec-AMP-D1-like n=1 Tax=Telopea speciosissima TaxID=54955 RepID=UPI001CC4FC99|nr:defensin Ec-AMP-D1-like [Telopea speciosissima]XP_043693992.1 defensin Ec-AMP-D1-like [Telopea speciosissima]